MPGPYEPGHPGATPSGAAGVEALVAQEDRRAVLSRLAQSVPRRWAVALLGLAIALIDVADGAFSGPWAALLAAPVVVLALNLWCSARWRGGRSTPRDFWVLLVVDALVIAWMCALTGPYGVLALPFYLVVNAGYGLGLPRAARVHLALAAVLYPTARALGAVVAGTRPSPWGIGAETLCLVGLAWIAAATPVEFTHRLRHTRRVLGALAHGDFTQRLPAERHDDLGFLAQSFNRTASALGELVTALRAEISERERVESALRTTMAELHDSRAALEHQAHHDALTGLANRARFHQRVARALAGPRAAHAAVLMLDLDGFKGVNDRLGHAAGDRLLADAAERLTRATRGCDTLARIGGDEFAVLLDERGEGEAEAMAGRVLDALRAPFAFEGEEARVGASVGIARNAGNAGAARGAAEPGDAGDALLRRADAAMYAAKSSGKARYALFEPPMLLGHTATPARPRPAVRATMGSGQPA